MTYERPEVPGRPPIMLGCAAALAAVVVLIGAGFCVGGYLTSGSDEGKLTLENADAYAPGSVEYLSEDNVFLVRFANGEFIALSDLDAANRASPGARCRVQLVSPHDPSLAGILQEYGANMSEEAAGATLVFRENCHGAVYDAAGVRIDREGPNLDRFEVREQGDGRLVLYTARRTCSERTDSSDVVTRAC